MKLIGFFLLLAKVIQTTATTKLFTVRQNWLENSFQTDLTHTRGYRCAFNNLSPNFNNPPSTLSFLARNNISNHKSLNQCQCYVVAIKALHSVLITHTLSVFKISVLQRRVLRLIITDFLCWMPVSLMAFLNLSGVPVPSIAYSISAIVLLPINSALNPLLYSKSFERLSRRLNNGVRRATANHATTAAAAADKPYSVSILFSKTSARLGFRKKEVVKKSSVSSEASVVPSGS